MEEQNDYYFEKEGYTFVYRDIFETSQRIQFQETG
jgi:hypothetical protein